MAEQRFVLVLLWTEDGEPNCNVYENVNAIDNPDDTDVAKRAVANPGELIPVDDAPDNKSFYKYTSMGLIP